MQPLDQGIIHTVKALFRNLLVHWLIAQADSQIEKKAKKIVRCINFTSSLSFSITR
jgi:hypothetical protein